VGGHGTGEQLGQLREPGLGVAVLDLAAGMPVVGRAARLHALPGPAGPGVRGDLPAVHEGEEPVELHVLVVVGVVAGGDHAVEVAPGVGAAAQLVDPFDEGDGALGGQRLLRVERRAGDVVEELEAHRGLRVEHVQVRELDERGERHAGVRPGGLRRAVQRVLAHLEGVAGPGGEAAVGAALPGLGHRDRLEGGPGGVQPRVLREGALGGEGRGGGAAEREARPDQEGASAEGREGERGVAAAGGGPGCVGHALHPSTGK